MTYQQAIHYLDSFVNYEKRDSYDYSASFKLDRMRAIIASLGDPQNAVPAIHVAGSKGKGSTAAMIQSILKSAGYRVGLYTSPHLVSFRERIRINDTLISEKDVGDLLATVKDAVDALGDDVPSFFEVYTALAFLYFKNEGVDFVVYEVGLGGRLDATTVITPLVSVITPISYEHTHILGSTLREIATEKAGIIKDGVVTVSAPQEREVLDVIERTSKERASRLVVVGRDINFKEKSASSVKEVFSVAGLYGKYYDLEISLVGSHQVMNAATAVGAVECLRSHAIEVGPDAIRRGLADAKWPGRLETVRMNPRIVLDGAQNKASANALAAAVKSVYKYQNLILVLGVSRDKDIAGILNELLPIADSVILTKSNVLERAMDPIKIKDLIGTIKENVMVTQCVEEALEWASAAANPDDLILVAGSLFVVGEARAILVDEKAYAQEGL